MSKQADLMRDRRRRFALPGGTHDRLIRILTVALPAGIGAMLAIMMIAPLFPRQEISFLLDRHKVAATDQRLRVDRAVYRGNDSRGRPFTVLAENAHQRSSTVPSVELTGLSARILLSDGPAEMRAATGRYDIQKNLIEVPGDIALHAADGYALTTGNVQIDLKGQRVAGANGVAGQVPSGQFHANRIDADLNARTVTLEGRARLTMQGK